MKILRTPDERFRNLPDFPYDPVYTDVGQLRMAHVEDGAGPVVLMLHGEPTWSFLYRRMIPVLAENGFRAVAPDLVGFGRSDKPAAMSDYSYAAHVAWTLAWMDAQALTDITLFCQDWGSLIGLRLAMEHPGRFSRIVVANGFLPTGDRPPNRAFRIWRAFARYSPAFPVGRIIQSATTRRLPPEVVRAYDAPFPSSRYKAGARVFPQLVPTDPGDPAVPANRSAWESLGRWTKPFLTAFGKKDPILGSADRILQRHVPGARGQPHREIKDGHHFVQEDAGEELARIVVDWVRKTPSSA